MFKKSLLTGLILTLSATTQATSGGGDKSLSPSEEYSSESFKKDLDVLLPLATKLKGKCLSEKDESACEKSNSIVSVLRELASKNTGGRTLSKEEQKKLLEMSVDVLRTGILDTIEAANSAK